MEQMSKGKRKLAMALALHTEALRSTFELLDEPAAAGLEAVPWVDVKQAAKQVDKHATMTGMLWCGVPKAIEASEKMETYVNDLHGFLLLCHGSTVGAGPTLLGAVKKVAGRVLETSLVLLNRTLQIETAAARTEALPPITGCVWEACEAVNKAPSDNRTAVGRSIVEVGASMKDVLRELNEAEAEDESTGIGEAGDDEEEDEEDEMLVFDVKFTQSELELTRKVASFVDGVLDVTRQLLYIVGKAPNTQASLEHLESVAAHCRNIGRDVEELGASSYPPQEIQQLKDRSSRIVTTIEQVTAGAAALLVETDQLPESLILQVDRTKQSYAELQQELLSERLAAMNLS